MHLLTLRDVEPESAAACDTLTTCLHELGREDEAAEAGARALVLKDRDAGEPPTGWSLPAGRPGALAAGKRDVIAFSLWGNDARYLRGALDNALAAPAIYPGWSLRFYVDESVPAELRAALARLGADVVLERPGQETRRKLAWRFQVANDPTVGRFLVRDADSVLSLRERVAVDAWIASDRWFHAMRDWWTHTDLVLAGMWGGVAGVLPPLMDLLDAYRPRAMETLNIDQWFLRDSVWRYLRQSCLVHDRIFSPPGTTRFPGTPPEGGVHVGQNAFAADRAGQAGRLGHWLPVLECLRLAGD